MRNPTREDIWRQYQARMWRIYAMHWDLTEYDSKRRWVEGILRVSRTDCIKRAREAWTRPNTLGSTPDYRIEQFKQKCRWRHQRRHGKKKD